MTNRFLRLNRIAIFTALTATLGLTACGPGTQEQPAQTPGGGAPPTQAGSTQAQGDQVSQNLDWKQVREYVAASQYSNNWEMISGTRAAPKRLGLPVHGHWVRTYLNPTAFQYFTNATVGDEPLNFPMGSCIVKENYGASKTVFAPGAMPGSLTVMYKNDSSFRQTSLSAYNSNGGYLGGNWFYAFFAVTNTAWKANGMNRLEASIDSNVTSFCIGCHSPAYGEDYVRTLLKELRPYSQTPITSYCDQVTQILPVSPPQPTNSVPPQYRDIPGNLRAYCHPTSLTTKFANVPADVPFDPTIVFENFGSEQAQTMFNCFAWKTFLALNWPNTGKPADRGKPDLNAHFIGPRAGPTVWETYKPTYEVFQPDQKNWDPAKQPWDQQQPAINCTNDINTSGELALTMVSKVRDVVNEEGQAFAGTFGYLVDQNGEKVHYEVLFNKTEFEYLIDGGRAATTNLTPVGPLVNGKLEAIDFPDNRSDTQNKIGAMEVKSAWKTLSIKGPHPDANSWREATNKFYVRDLYVYDAEKQTCSRQRLGLVGLHIAHKTWFAPQWIWMTFEHNDNVPLYGEKTQSSFFSPSVAAYAPPETVPTNCWTLPFISTDTNATNCVNVDLNRFSFAFPNAPNQVTRLDPVDKAARAANKTFQALLGGSPFANYKLIGVQWPLHGRNKSGDVVKQNCADNGISANEECFTMVPPHLRNTSMESFMSTYCSVSVTNKTTGSVTSEVKQFSNRSCMGCHGEGGTDFSYVYLDAVTQRVPIK